jgi:hypothetical protein
MGPSTLSTRAPYLGSEIHGPGTQVDFGRAFKPALAAKLFIFFDFSFALAFRKVLFIFSS